ncbi:MAG: methylenetetrahydrofolate reductase [NAD(P)H] [Thermodesulfobacteriota bacterium]|nr:methylenetetrahydrofolate reductase [NAD(P)H] [Thermodesulfobacteriota bacterium]
MKIKNLFIKNPFILSFEVFPPVRNGNLSGLFLTIKHLVNLNPDFISVTYGAGGNTQDMTLEISSRIKNNLGTEVLTHLTCVNAAKDYIAGVLDDLKKANIKNILALRGDPPRGEQSFVKTKGGFGYANELVEFIKTYGDFSIWVAGYPEGHIEAPDIETDIENLKLKVDAGADFIITQLFFNNDDFYRFRDKALDQGISVPIIPGIFPIFNFNQIAKIASLCGAAIPDRLYEKLHSVRDNIDEMEKYGIEYAIRQSENLLENDIPGIHFYSMNRSRHVTQVVRELNIGRGREYEKKNGIAGGAV